MLAAALMSVPALAQQQFASTSARSTVIELFTSEGCSSCPPADRWLSRLKDDPRLWRELVPMAFHVDYWDYIGWQDRFADAQFSARQRAHQRSGNLRSVYTPGFVVNGKEWRGWFSGRKMPDSGSQAGVLRITLDGSRVTAEYDRAEEGAYELSVALLGFDLSNDVASGENAGKRLRHDFVVLATHSSTAADGRWQFDFSALERVSSGRLAISAWVSRKGDPAPLQATGGWLDG
ncbi:MAG: DUF1223 domain-containing protein [Gammaproteobacteria bacterium]|nr:DUF1223 domain-containing protein [Gammaproteobacteria bacterium]